MSDFAPRYPVTPGDQSTATFGPTPSQTVGPYWKIGLDWGTDGENVVPADTPGRITVRITVLDGHREPMADAMLETWQADTDGRYGAPGFRGFARSAADETGTAVVHTVKPGSGDGQAPHLLVGIFARGTLDRLYTRMYFPEDLAEHATDPVLTALPESQRAKLVADKTGDGYEWTVYVQDLDPNGVETPFFSI
ncbi:protocatechuate 3,4-dioxygenase subunit alpha [Rhodococcus sp. HM1]|uniref:protocatechuate 3,4-dioxygenase subunit alpha n=1 Tax=unclassified Rhodococcus (in: high G+C Gram-positive bacteria) TaxID=192944 RepID=UPI0018CEBE0C|nr:MULTISPECIES: protocatechuate 3,4-dioxygenase subunit alpha [unclassified Rhodococcus (in: high G+C Gram-positive bacteria)]MBH0118182.1 protocatechuate 3,4-dioxygenase subunit alpha [Rhodococcus sp. CX]MCK8673976.1 protocatechuate 3,4-dioxygenase subunit alpha [Rhodococcus sp. HM1]